jgi:hypothetical protein
VPLPPRWAVIGAVRESQGVHAGQEGHGGQGVHGSYGVLVDGRPYDGAPGWDHFR